MAGMGEYGQAAVRCTKSVGAFRRRCARCLSGRCLAKVAGTGLATGSRMRDIHRFPEWGVDRNGLGRDPHGRFLGDVAQTRRLSILLLAQTQVPTFHPVRRGPEIPCPARQSVFARPFDQCDRCAAPARCRARIGGHRDRCVSLPAAIFFWIRAHPQAHTRLVFHSRGVSLV